MKFFGHTRPVRDKESGRIIDSKVSPVRARTREPLGSSFGTDRDKRLIVSLDVLDQIVIRPERTQRPEQAAAADVYAWMIRNRVTRERMEKRKNKKKK